MIHADLSGEIRRVFHPLAQQLRCLIEQSSDRPVLVAAFDWNAGATPITPTSTRKEAIESCL